MDGMTSWQLWVDGHQWLVEERPGTPGCYDCEWLTGRNPGYGFTTRTSKGTPLSMAYLGQAIRDFMADINPETGYLD